MPNMMHLQSNFTLGEIDERLHARVDLDILGKGAKRARNVVVLPQGGVRRRFGTKYTATLAIATAASESRLFMFEFEDETEYLLLFEHLSLKIYHDDALVSTEVSPYTAAQLPSIKFTQGSNNFVTVHPDVEPYVLERVTAHTSWSYAAIAFTWMPTNDFNMDYDALTFTPSGTTGTITLTASGGTSLTADHVGGLFFGNEGTLRITSVNVGAQTCVGDTITDFADTSAISGKHAVLKEPVWSATHGYPRCATFFQDRLCYGGSAALPQGVWMSKINDYVDFNDGETEVLAINSIGVFINTDNANVVEDMIAEKAFMVFTSTGLVATPMLNNSPITPTNIVFNLQNSNGIGGARPALFDNKVIYLDKGGKVLWGCSFDVQLGGTTSSDLSLFSQSLLDDPLDMAVYKNPSIDNGLYLILVNDNGTLAILQSIAEQNVLGWTLCTTDGEFRHIATSRDIVYFIVEREIDGNTVFYIEKLDFSLYMDATSVQDLGAPGTAVSGLDHLEGEEVHVIGDGKLQNGHSNPKTVASGAITLDNAATDVEIGLIYDPSVIPLPVSIATQNGNDLYLAKRIKTFWVDYYQTLGIYVNDQLIPFIKLDVSQFDTAPTPVTNFSEVTPMVGWDPRAEVEITQKDPYPMILRGVGQELEI